MPIWKSLTSIVAATLAIGVAGALSSAPLAALGGVAATETNQTMQSNLQDLTEGSAPGVSTITDKNGAPIAWLYKQRRFEVAGEDISQAMKDAIVSIEDRRFYEHRGVDIQGNFRAIATNLLAGGVEQGASTIDQQYVKNYLLLVTSESEEEQAAAIETSIPRKLREMRMASEIDKTLPKDAILTNYLNLIPFGNGAYGIEAAARTYFGVTAKELNVPQSAMLAGIVQSSSYLNPYANAEAVLERRNTVLEAMVQTGAITEAEGDQFRLEPLGVLEQPQGLPNGCIASGNAGFFCDYALKYLADRGISQEELTRGGYTVTTTLDPQVQEIAQNAVAGQVSPTTPGVANVLNVIEPGENSRSILAMASSRNYGLNLEAGETVLPQTSSLVGDGAGSVFKIFAAAEALNQGYGLDTVLQVPARYEVRGMGEGGAAGCPPGTYCVENAGVYPASMTLTEALAQSPNTPFVQMIEKVGVSKVVDLSVKMGLRSYAEPGSFDGTSSIADYVKNHNLGSYVLGPTAINALEMSNVAATIASNGKWCEPSPVSKVTNKYGQEVFIQRPPCEEALKPKVASALAHGMSQDTARGTAANAARALGWNGPLAAKTGTTESHKSAAFMGLNSKFAAVTYIYNDGTTITPLCTSPVVQCQAGTLYGGEEPARTWFAAALPMGASSGTLPALDPSFKLGETATFGNEYKNKPLAEAKAKLEVAGYQVTVRYAPGNGVVKDRVLDVQATPPLKPGTQVTLVVSDGTTAPAPRPAPSPSSPEAELNDLVGHLVDLFGAP